MIYIFRIGMKNDEGKKIATAIEGMIKSLHISAVKYNIRFFIYHLTFARIQKGLYNVFLI